MALTNQPYFPLYPDDYLSDEKLKQCEPESEGVYIRIMCNMHKSKSYGKIILTDFDKAKLKQKLSKVEANTEQIFLIKHLGYNETDFKLMVLKIQSLVGRENSCVLKALIDLIGNDVLQFSENFLAQKRMLKDGELSVKRAKSGGKGGSKNKSKDKANYNQNPVNVNEDVIEDEDVIETKKFNKVDFKKKLLEYNATEQHIDDWLRVRTQKKGVFTKTALDKFLKECKKNSFPVAKAVQICAEKGWVGFEYQWVLNINGNHVKQLTTTADDNR